MSIRIGLVQMASIEDAQANLDAILRFAAQAKASGCSAVCFPEACLSGYFPARASELALQAEDPLLDHLAAQAQALGIDLLVGYMERAGDFFYLTHSLFRADGQRHDYRKTHLGERERRIFSAGDCLRVFPLTCGMTAGIQLCLETHFPEITQTLSLRGAQIVFAPHAVPTAADKRRALWQTYIPARAYDSRVYVACCNAWDGVRFHGGCYAVNPRGETIGACFEDKPQLLCLDIDPALPSSFRSAGGDMHSRYYPAQRREELYHAE